MNTIDAQRPASDVTTALEDWYCDHSSIRHLWAIDSPLALLIFVKLEPTADGDDPLPVWLAHQHTWRSDLKSRTNRDVQLELIVSDIFTTSEVDSSSAMIAELSWRDPWHLQA